MADAQEAFLLRIDPELWAELERWAAGELRSVNGQIEFLLREALLPAASGRSRPEKPDPTGTTRPTTRPTRPLAPERGAVRPNDVRLRADDSHLAIPLVHRPDLQLCAGPWPSRLRLPFGRSHLLFGFAFCWSLGLRLRFRRGLRLTPTFAAGLPTPSGRRRRAGQRRALRTTFLRAALRGLVTFGFAARIYRGLRLGFTLTFALRMDLLFRHHLLRRLFAPTHRRPCSRLRRSPPSASQSPRPARPASAPS